MQRAESDVLNVVEVVAACPVVISRQVHRCVVSGQGGGEELSTFLPPEDNLLHR